jgi:hypothetical protein
MCSTNEFWTIMNMTLSKVSFPRFFLGGGLSADILIWNTVFKTGFIASPVL